jgi:ketosteroid isomerase-like protein
MGGPRRRRPGVLREVFDIPYEEVAEAIGKTPAAVRQIAHRARGHVAARRPRVRVSRAEQDAVVERFLVAVRGGDLQGLLDVLAPDVVLVADGGGIVAAATRPVATARKVATLLAAWAHMTGDNAARPMWVNGGPALRFEMDGELNTVASFVIEDGHITRIYAVRNPDKLARIEEEAELRR